MPVNAVPAGETVLPPTVVPRGVVVDEDGDVAVVPLTVVPVVELLDVTDVDVPPGVVVLVPASVVVVLVSVVVVSVPVVRVVVVHASVGE